MKLIWSPSSPYARKVMIVAHETGLASSLELMNGSGTPVAPNPETAAYNPLGKLPCLIPDDAPAIYDSRVICQYLIARSGDEALLPAEGARRWAALTLEALGDGICDAALLIRYEGVLREEGHRSATWTGGQMSKIDRALDAVEGRWQSHLSGPFDLGQAAMAMALGYLDFRYAEKDWRSGHPGLARWFESVCERPSLRATQPEG